MQSKASTDKAVNDIKNLLSKGDKLEAKEIDVMDLSRIISKMPNKNNRETAQAVINALFDIAAEKIKDDHNKGILEGLRKYIGVVEEDLYQPKPRYLDAFFFPNEKNIDKIVTYLGKANKSLKICVFNLTNDKLANAVKAAFDRKVDVRVISDDECMNNQGSDIRWLAGEGIPVRVDDNA